MATLTVTAYENVTAAQANPLCFDGTSVWMGLHFQNDLEIQQQSPADGSILNSYTIGVSEACNYRPQCIAFAGSIWFGSGLLITPGSAADMLYQVEPSTGALQGTFDLTGAGDIASGLECVGLCTDGTSLYTLCTYTNTSAEQVSTLTAINAAGAVLWSVELAFPEISGPVFDGTYLWTANWNNGTLTQYTTAAGALNNTVSPAGASPSGLAFANGDIWAVDGNQNLLWQIVAATGAIVGSSALGNNFPYYVQADASDNLWVIAQDFSNNYHMLIFDDTGALIIDYTFPGSGASPSFALNNSLAFADGRMFGTGVTAVSGNPALFAMLLTTGGGSGQFYGTFVGIFGSGHLGGGTK